MVAVALLAPGAAFALVPQGRSLNSGLLLLFFFLFDERLSSFRRVASATTEPRGCGTALMAQVAGGIVSESFVKICLCVVDDALFRDR